MSTPTRFVAFGDNHGDMADHEATDALCEFIKDYKPTVRVHLGDCFDFRSLRRGVRHCLGFGPVSRPITKVSHGLKQCLAILMTTGITLQNF